MTLRTPPLREKHAERGAKFTEFGGWDMPVEFTSIREEHRSVREHAGIFDVSHMGEIKVAGPDSLELMQRLTTNDVASLDPGEAQYSTITNEDGVILDDTVVYRLPGGDDADYLFIPNAGHDGQMYERWTDYRDDRDLAAEVDNVTGEYGMVAVQGPEAADIVANQAGRDVLDLGRFEAAYADIAGVKCWVARTGYTGEDGFEVAFPTDGANAVWNALADDVQPCGLGARDTLRIEMGFLLSGQDFHHEENPRTPLEAGVGFAVDLDTEFVGRDALARQQEGGVDETFVGLQLLDRGVPREGYEIRSEEGETVGVVTSGTMSPTLEEPIGLGYVDAAVAEDGTDVFVVIRGDEKRAKLTTPPFVEGY